MKQYDPKPVPSRQNDPLSEGLLWHIFEHSSELIAIVDRNFNFVRVNETYAKADGKRPDDFIGRNHFDLYPSDEVEVLFTKAVQTGTAIHVYSRPFSYPDHPEWGVSYWDWAISPILNGQGEVEYLLFTLRDVTRRHLVEVELQSFWDLSSDLFCVIENGCYKRLNQAFHETLRFTLEDLLNRPMIEFVHPEDQTDTLASINSPGRKTNHLSFTNRHRCKDGTYKWLAWSFTPHEGVGRWYAVARDITIHMQHEQERKRISNLELLAQMSASIAHEVRNPLSAVRASLQLLGLRAKGKDNKIFETMTSELDRANSILDRFMYLSKDSTLHREELDLNSVLEDLYPLLHAEAYGVGIDIEYDLNPVPLIPLDGEQMCQLILNLSRNAIEAMGTSGKVTIRTFLEDDCLYLVVKDEGPGIPPELLDRIGEPFFTTKNSGTGLGMAICKKIVSQHDGKLHIDSTDAGTSVIVQFSQPNETSLELSS